MTNRMPVVRQISWLATIPQFAALGVAMGLGWAFMGSAEGFVWGAAVYLAYSFGSRALIPYHHRRGIRLSAGGRYREAIREYEASYDFFIRHAWLDRFRSVVMMSPSAVGYREMALVNMAYCHGQLGNGSEAKKYYERALREFPESSIAKSALRFIESVQREGEP